MSDTPPAPPPTPPPAPPADWRASLPDDLKGDANLSTIPDVATLAKNFVMTKAMTGKKAYDLPQADWKPEQWAAWNKTIGVPEAADKYSPVDKAILEKAGLPPEVITSATAKFHEMGLTDRQAKGLLDWYTGDTIKGREMQATQGAAERAQSETALKQEFGDKYEAKLGLLKSWISHNATPAFAVAVEKAGLGSNPDFVKAIIKSAEQTLEDSSRSGHRSPFGPGSSQAAALGELEAMKARRMSDKAYNQLFYQPKSAERERWDQLHAAGYNGKAA